MRPSSFRLFLVPLTVLAAGMPVRGDEKLDLAAVFQRTEQMNSSVLTGRETATQAHAAADSQRVALLPNVSLRAQQERSQGVTVTNTSAIQGTAASRFDGQLNGSLSLLNLQQSTTYKSARRGAEAADADAESTLQFSLASAADFYFTELRNQARDVVLTANVARAQDLLTLAQNQLNAGIVTRIDVTRAEAQLALARLAQLQNQTTRKQGAQQLLLALDFDAMQSVSLKDINLVPQMTKSSAAVLSTRELVATNFFARRADWRRSQHALEQAVLDEKAASYERAPSLALTGSYGQAAAYFDSGGKQDEWATGIALTVPVFDGLRSSADRRAALSRRRVQEIRLHALENQIKAEIDFAEADANSRIQQIEVAQQNLQLAKDQLQLAQQRYKEGVADNREIIEAQNQLALADDNAIEARYRYNLSRVELARAKGEVRDVLGEKTE